MNKESRLKRYGEYLPEALAISVDISLKVPTTSMTLTCHQFLTFYAPCFFESYIKIKIDLNFYFYTSLWYLKRFYEGL